MYCKYKRGALKIRLNVQIYASYFHFLPVFTGCEKLENIDAWLMTV